MAGQHIRVRRFRVTIAPMRENLTGLRPSLNVSLGFAAALWAAVALAACSSSSGGGADAFVGTWNVQSGTITPMNCSLGGQSVGAVDLTGDQLVVTKKDAGHVSVALGSSCTVTFKSDGATASADPGGQMCGVTVSGGLTVTVDITQWTMTASGDTMTLAMSGSVPLLPGCTVSGTGSLTRQAPIDAGGGQ
jgi:hypothetical protein